MKEITEPGNILWQQPNFSSPQTTDDSGVYVEKWKGSYDMMKDIPGSLSSDMSISDAHSKLVAAGFSLSSHYNVPAAGQLYGPDGQLHNASWVWSEANVIEQTAGALGILELTYKRKVPGQQETVTPDTEEWGISWQSYNVNPYAFCKQDQHRDDRSPFANPAPADQKSNRNHIKSAIAYAANTDSQANTLGIYSPGGNTAGSLKLNQHEFAIMNKVLQEKTAVYHYPVVTRRANYVDRDISLSSSILSTDVQGSLGQYLDTIVTLPQSCPLDIQAPDWSSGSWSWVLVDDQAKITVDPAAKKCSAYRQVTWWGTLDPDVNFYGSSAVGELSGRWVIGEM